MKPFMKTIVALFCVLIMGAASTAGMKADAVAPNAVAPNAVGRYILSGTVERQAVIPGEDINGNKNVLLYCSIVDENGELWVYAYDLQSAAVPPLGQHVTLIMNVNGTPDDITDDIIEDVLWCDCVED